jgi:LacI family transcriptional regulator
MRKKRIAVSLELAWLLKYHQEVFAGAMDYARECGDWDCVIGPFPERLLRVREGPRHYDGILARATRPMAAAARSAGIPLVNVWYSSPVTGQVPTLAPDLRESGRMAARHLLARGFRRFAFVGIERRDRSTKDVLAGFAGVLREARVPLQTVRVPTGFAEEVSVWEGFSGALEDWIAGQRLPVGILCDHDLLARYVANELVRHGVSIPHQAGLIGVGNEEMVCLHPEPSLTTIDNGYRRIGFAAARMLDRMIDGERSGPRLVLLPPKDLVPRASTDSLVVEDEIVSAALRFIAERCRDPIRVGDVAAAVHVSRRTLERRFRDVLGQPVARQISLQRVERAKRLLVEGDPLGKQVARTCGFPSAVQMWLTFKRCTGLSPTAFRRRHGRPGPRR